MNKTPFYQYTYPELCELFKLQELHPAGAAKLVNWYYRYKQLGPCELEIAKKSRVFIEETFSFDLPRIQLVQESKDRTVKFLMEFKDQTTVEVVLIPFINKYSLCLSSQVGCAMKCSFCHTGTQALKRSLECDEIVGQFIQAWRWLEANRPGDFPILNVVFMGQGEPLHNFEAVKQACQIFIDREGIGLSPHKVTVSTSGYLPGLKRWVEEMPRVNIALSLHSPFKEKRDQLIPINVRYPLEEVIAYLDTIPLHKKQYVTYEYLLIKDFNDGSEDAEAVGQLLEGKKAIINLIPFNPFPGPKYERPSMEKVEAFKAIVESYRLPTMIRKTKGDEILAACGQLKTYAN